MPASISLVRGRIAVADCGAKRAAKIGDETRAAVKSTQIWIAAIHASRALRATTKLARPSNSLPLHASRLSASNFVVADQRGFEGGLRQDHIAQKREGPLDHWMPSGACPEMLRQAQRCLWKYVAWLYEEGCPAVPLGPRTRSIALSDA